jgi:hypothetical protein
MYPAHATTKTANINQAGKARTLQVPVTPETRVEVMLRQPANDANSSATVRRMRELVAEALRALRVLALDQREPSRQLDEAVCLLGIALRSLLDE